MGKKKKRRGKKVEKIRGGPFLAPACRHVSPCILGVECFVSKTDSVRERKTFMCERDKSGTFFFVKKGHIFPFIVGRDKSTQKDVYLLYTHLHVRACTHAHTHTHTHTHTEFSPGTENLCVFLCGMCVFSRQPASLPSENQL